MSVIKRLLYFWQGILLLKNCCGKKFLYIFGIVDSRTKLLRERNQIVRDIHTEFRALNIEIPSVVETKTEGFMNFLGDLDGSEGRNEKSEKQR